MDEYKSVPVVVVVVAGCAWVVVVVGVDVVKEISSRIPSPASWSSTTSVVPVLVVGSVSVGVVSELVVGAGSAPAAKSADAVMTLVGSCETVFDSATVALAMATASVVLVVLVVPNTLAAVASLVLLKGCEGDGVANRAWALGAGGGDVMPVLVVVGGAVLVAPPVARAWEEDGTPAPPLDSGEAKVPAALALVVVRFVFVVVVNGTPPDGGDAKVVRASIVVLLLVVVFEVMVAGSCRRSGAPPDGGEAKMPAAVVVVVVVGRLPDGMPPDGGDAKVAAASRGEVGGEGEDRTAPGGLLFRVGASTGVVSVADAKVDE